MLWCAIPKTPNLAFQAQTSPRGMKQSLHPVHLAMGILKTQHHHAQRPDEGANFVVVACSRQLRQH